MAKVDAPDYLKAVLWDVDFTNIDDKEHKNFIIERKSNSGNEKAFRWMFETYSENEIVKTVISSNNRKGCQHDG